MRFTKNRDINDLHILSTHKIYSGCDELGSAGKLEKYSSNNGFCII